MQPLDLLVFKGGDLIADVISIGQFLANGGANSLRVNHVGIVMNSEWCPVAKINPGELYIWESTLADDIVDAETGKKRLGVQFRPLNSAISAYKANGKVGVCKLLNRPELTDDLKDRICEIYKTYNGQQYTMNPLDLLGAVFPSLRPARDKTIEYLEDRQVHVDHWMFCSEFVATVYRDLGILPQDTIPKNVVPSDFISKDIDGMPRVVSDPEWL